MAQLNDLIVNGNTRFLNSAYGNLVGSASTALNAGTATNAANADKIMTQTGNNATAYTATSALFSADRAKKSLKEYWDKTDTNSNTNRPLAFSENISAITAAAGNGGDGGISYTTALNYNPKSAMLTAPNITVNSSIVAQKISSPTATFGQITGGDSTQNFQIYPFDVRVTEGDTLYSLRGIKSDIDANFYKNYYQLALLNNPNSYSANNTIFNSTNSWQSAASSRIVLLGKNNVITSDFDVRDTAGTHTYNGKTYEDCCPVIMLGNWNSANGNSVVIGYKGKAEKGGVSLGDYATALSGSLAVKGGCGEKYSVALGFRTTAENGSIAIGSVHNSTGYDNVITAGTGSMVLYGGYASSGSIATLNSTAHTGSLGIYSADAQNGSIAVYNSSAAQGSIAMGGSQTSSYSIGIGGAKVSGNSIGIGGATARNGSISLKSSSAIDNSISLDGGRASARGISIAATATDNSIALNGAFAQTNSIAIAGGSAKSNSMAINASTADNNSIAWGAANSAKDTSFAFGNGLRICDQGFAIGNYNETTSGKWLVIGNGTDDSHRHDLLHMNSTYLNYNGRINIGEVAKDGGDPDNGILDLTGSNLKYSLSFVRLSSNTTHPSAQAYLSYTMFNSPSAKGSTIPGAGKAGGWMYVIGSDNQSTGAKDPSEKLGFYSEIIGCRSAYFDYVSAGNANFTPTVTNGVLHF